MDFGKYAVIDNVTHNFEKEPEMWWKFRPATVADELEMQRWVAKQAKLDLAPSYMEVAIKQISLVSEATNIPGAGLENGGTPIQFEQLLQQLPFQLFEEIFVALGEVNPLWGPPRPQTPQEKKTEESSPVAIS